jgi:hypothetical protein
MRHGPCVVLLLIVAIGCGSNGTKGTDGGGGGGASGGGGGAPAICASFACLQTVQDLMTGCVGGGACVSQNDLVSTPMTLARCYDNGVKTLITITTTTDSSNYTSATTTKVKKGANLCYTRNNTTVTPMQADAGAFVSMDITTLDSSGTLVATAHVDANAVTTVTCPGGAPTVLPASCGVSPLVISGSFFVDASGPACTSGTCSF